MQRHTRLTLALAVPFALAGGGAAHAAILSDDFDGATIDGSKWTTTGGTVSLDGASHVIAQANPGAWTGAIVISQATDLNFYNAPLTFEIDGLTFNGMGTAGGYATGYLAVGLSGQPDQTWTYRPTNGANGMWEGIVLSVRQPSASTAPYELLIDAIHGGVKVSSGAYGLDALPTGLALTLDGDAGTYAITLDGAEFQWGGDDEGGGSVRTTALPVGMDESSFHVNGNFHARMAFGAYSIGEVVVGQESRLTVDSASVSVVPEPATLGLIGASLLLMAGRWRSASAA